MFIIHRTLFSLTKFIDLLEVCDFDRYKDSINLERELNENADFGDDLAVAVGKEKSNVASEELDSENEEMDFDDEMSIASNSDTEVRDDDSEEYEESESDIEKETTKMSEKQKPSKKCIESEVTTNKNELQKTEIGRVTNDKNDLKKTKNEKKPDVSDRMKMLQAFVSKESNSRVESDNNSMSEDEQLDVNSADEFEGAKTKKDQFKEDIYGRLRDKEGNIVQVRE